MASMKPKKSSLPPPKPRERQAITVGKQREVNTRLVIGIVVAAVVVLGAVVALLVSGGDDDDDATGESIPVADCTAVDVTDGPVVDASDLSVGEFAEGEIAQPVGVAGEALEPFTGAVPDPVWCAPAPIVSGYDYEGNAITIDAATDGPTLVVLLAHWCPHCNAEIPRLNEWRDAGDVPDGLNIVGVSTGAEPDAPNFPPDEWLVDKDWEWPVLADDAAQSAFQAFGAQGYPTLVVIGADGLVLGRTSGELPVDLLDRFVRDALAADTA